MLKRRPDVDDDLDDSFDVAERDETDPRAEYGDPTETENEEESDEVPELGMGDQFGRGLEYADDELEEEY